MLVMFKIMYIYLRMRDGKMCWFSESNSHVYVHQCPDLVLNHEILFFKNIHELVLYLKSFVLYGRETC